ncbi:DinB family protein [Mesobacillus persicus]|uniref:DinB family protein n=1 Tax=Mesobacillus persicus TaxID=930146 RepID=UPI001FCD9A47|nr:DinB family protein [Mesobacillus persicus]
MKINHFMDSWMSHRKALLELIDTFENEHLNYRPWDKAMTLSELVLHISSSTGMFVESVKNGVFAPPSTPKMPETTEELKQLVEKETQQTKRNLEELTESQLNQIVEFSGMKMPGMALLESAKDHEIHHKGQVFTYARLIGIENLPFFISR